MFSQALATSDAEIQDEETLVGEEWQNNNVAFGDKSPSLADFCTKD